MKTLSEMITEKFKKLQTEGIGRGYQEKVKCILVTRKSVFDFGKEVILAALEEADVRQEVYDSVRKKLGI